MCRLLAVRSPAPVPIIPYLEQFARLAQASKAYQGHGWGIAYRDAAEQWVLQKYSTCVGRRYAPVSGLPPVSRACP